MSDNDLTDEFEDEPTSGADPHDTATFGMDFGDEPAQPAKKDNENYEVLARKYRPQTFDDLIGQEALVRTLTNAFETGRIAHGFILTGVRGIGKTTTARIIARALNCIGPDGNGGPTIKPCGVCSQCTSIAASSNVDVLEMDAASHTGIDDIRDITDGARYAPASARYKVYIIDEVHMLSTAAFNGLLKTLEEPPGHVKFIFATTEIRKVPVTVLSRCQRFDLKRLDGKPLADHLGNIASKEGAKLEEDALALLARAAEGSVRDGLSLLDQAIAQHSEDGAAISAETVRDMLGLADRARIVDLFEAVMTGDASTALTELSEQYNSGADPLVVVQDLAHFTHFVTRLKVVGDKMESDATEQEKVRGGQMAAMLSVPALTRAWQMLLKGIGEVQTASSPLAAAEMLLIRLCYAANLPTPGDLVKKLQDGALPQGGAAPAAPSGSGGGTSAMRASRVVGGADAVSTTQRPQPQNFDAVVALARSHDIAIALQIERAVRLVCFKPGHIEVALEDGTPREFTGKLTAKLKEWTGERWIISVKGTGQAAGGEDTIRSRKQAEKKALEDQMRQHPLVKAALELFPEAEMMVRDLAPPAPSDDVPMDRINDEGEVTHDDDDGDFFI